MDECDKRGNSCPSRLKCITRDNITHECGCEKADNVVKGEGKKRFCKGKIMFIFSGPGCWKCGYCNPLDEYYPKDNAIGFRNTGADPGFFLWGGALVSCSTSTPINHIVFLLFRRIPVVLENRRSSGGVRTPCTLPLDPPLLKTCPLDSATQLLNKRGLNRL